MIKVTKLMINDWVSINGSNYQVKDIKKKGVIKLYENTQWGEHEVDFNTDSLEEFLEPIPLTEEILEKNGFDKFTWRKHGGNDVITYSFDGFQIQVNEDGTFSLVDNCSEDGDYGFESNWICDIKHVHKLQHLLKDLEIEKEIIL